MLFTPRLPSSSVNWADLFERAEEYETDVETIRQRLAAHREEGGSTESNTEEADDA
jgi:predicted ATP-grasp superfamily ATP-dependent carboligase